MQMDYANTMHAKGTVPVAMRISGDNTRAGTGG